MLCDRLINAISLLISTEYFCFQAEDGIRDLVRSRGLGDVYKRQAALRAEPPQRAHTTNGAVSQCSSSYEKREMGEIDLSLIHI